MLYRLWLIFALVASVSASLFGKGSGVPELSASNFKSNVLYNGNVSVVAFFAPWCGYCQQLAPELKKAAKALKGVARVSAVDCDKASNSALCQNYGVKGFPTIKVFQPGKLTDVDFKDVLDGKPVPRRRPKTYTYNGERTSKAITEFAISKLRNYAATLKSDDALRWLAPNLVPRVLMLPGKKYKSKLISPLFKILSREYFGKMRFATVPRRVDGAWNLLGLQAPDESQLVYMSDDKEPVIYKGSMKKKPIMKFLNEQYKLEMDRRKSTGKKEKPDREKAANGFEYVDEDKQNGELEHVKTRKLMAFAERKKALEEKKSAYKRAGYENDEAYLEVDAEIQKIDKEEKEMLAQSENSESETGSDDVIPDFNDETDQTVSEAVVEEDGDEEVQLDEAIVDIKPDEMVNEGPEALSSYLSSLQATKTNTAKTATKGGAKPTTDPRPLNELGIRTYDNFVERCLRSGYHCIAAVVKNETFNEDMYPFARSIKTVPNSMRKETLFEFIIPNLDKSLDDFLESIGATNTPSVIHYDPRRQRVGLMHNDYSFDGISKFLGDVVKREVTADIEIIPKYLYWVTEKEVKEQVESKKSKANEFKDEL